VDQQRRKHESDIASEVLEHLKNPPVEIIDPRNNSGSATKKYLLVILALVVILAAGGFAAWKFLLNGKNSSTNQSETESADVVPTSPEVSSNQLNQDYTSDRLLIDFKHPAGWKVDEDSGEITITSTEVEITDVSGEDVQSEFKILIKQGADQSDSEYLGRGFALDSSESIKYNDPASNQRKKSLITGFGLDSSDSFAFFVLQGNFKLEKDETLGPDFAKEPDAILVSGGFYSKDSGDKTKLVFLDPETYQTNEIYLAAVEIVKTLRLR
jgi:hypothetical protein